MTFVRPVFLPLAFVLSLAVAACGERTARDDDDAATANVATPAGQEATLPRPAPDAGSVTGMPDKPGPGPVGPPPSADGEGEGEPTLPPEAMAPGAGSVEGEPPAANAAQQADASAAGGAAQLPEPTPADALAVVRGYYAALGSGDFARARSLWSEGGAASGNSAQDLAARYADTTALAVDAGAPGRVDAAAGSRYIKVPVTVTRTLADGSLERSTGIVALRRSVVDGATPEQRAWRIAWAELHPVAVPQSP